MSYHKECNPDEEFLGNCSAIKGIDEYLKELKTIRLGNIAYSINGEVLDDNYKPVIINKSECKKYDDIMMAILKKDRESQYEPKKIN